MSRVPKESEPQKIVHKLAHVRRDGDEFIPHDLDEHLREVGRLAAEYAKSFGSADWARVAGLWHDLGKYSVEFQQRIKSVSGYDTEAHIEEESSKKSCQKVDHSTAGAQYARDQFGDQFGSILAYLIAGHHTGLPDWRSTSGTKGLSLNIRLDDRTHLKRALNQRQFIPHEILSQAQPTSRPSQGEQKSFALWVRMLFSCLVDADFLDTEAFMEGERARLRRNILSPSDLLPLFNSYMEEKISNLPSSHVNRIRAKVLHQCRSKASQTHGLFSLTVPTGGGKTLSSLAFALEHAVFHKKRRIIYAIPYTSIIEQTVDVFRKIFEKTLPDAVIEHHSHLDPNKETAKNRLVAENWDGPLIVTTNVQFFESLFAARTSRCRKIHNIVNSVVVLDEAQLLPPEFLQPILDVMNTLTRHYGVTFVLSTATQPALGTKKNFQNELCGLDNIHEIIEEPDSLQRDLERVTVMLPQDFNSTKSWENIAREIQEHPSVLVVVNSRKEARELHSLMPRGAFHLSASMCGEHRSQVILDIKNRLHTGESVCVVSTQLVEAGVDMDFPVVYRALAGLDSIAQAAGRCNREGKLKRGQVIVFVPPSGLPSISTLRRAAQKTISLLSESRHRENPFTGELFSRYFERFYMDSCLDKHNIVELLTPDNSLAVQFRTAARYFRLIDESDRQSILVHYGEGSRFISDLQDQKEKLNRRLMRRLQRYTVSLPKSHFERLLESGDVYEVYQGIFAQREGLYNLQLGVITESIGIKSSDLII